MVLNIYIYLHKAVEIKQQQESRMHSSARVRPRMRDSPTRVRRSHRTFPTRKFVGVSHTRPDFTALRLHSSFGCLFGTMPPTIHHSSGESRLGSAATGDACTRFSCISWSLPKSIWFMQMMMLLLILVCDVRVREKWRFYGSVWCSFDLLCNRSCLIVCLCARARTAVHVCQSGWKNFVIDLCQWRHQPDQCISMSLTLKSKLLNLNCIFAHRKSLKIICNIF